MRHVPELFFKDELTFDQKPGKYFVYEDSLHKETKLSFKKWNCSPVNCQFTGFELRSLTGVIIKTDYFQLLFTGSNSTIKIIEKGVKYVQS